MSSPLKNIATGRKPNMSKIDETITPGTEKVELKYRAHMKQIGGRGFSI
jgi:hypothetical protein